MGNAAGQDADRLQFARFRELQIDLFALGHIDARADIPREASFPQKRDTDVENEAILAAMLVETILELKAFILRKGLRVVFEAVRRPP